MSIESPSALPAVSMQEQAWLLLENAYEVEAWLELHDRELQQVVAKNSVAGHGVCFTLLHGGELYLHTNSDGDILLDLSPEAAWIAPVVTAVTQVEAPRAQIWLLRGHLLTQLILGLNSLIASSRLVLRHEFRTSKK
ncbi:MULTISPECIES: hypothetical protein [unclassified Undibacterium]|uniref:hypothetical protein n=1 Tax=unclassified Undibacterium TaxID=2630295 RepID=UPI002AC98351|nr:MULTISPECIES: hypothetical protein [unclassified Undibacterium]MEB0138832.1 hypothetical protein [Undibacterium sp. CCC2.1]MEB0172306.1 hypothetical protein [Undibacterium sp. CCC1.1]MEB0176077.1 hypothetical protein [Undibacterium sp. CCC3.4]MEB0216929.1 hypothetical protein [Undibacterium sp. 5I2]WPX44780.1 hypothetical protein RHM61_06015 [Undibacterium sp. CCC3.4]